MRVLMSFNNVGNFNSQFSLVCVDTERPHHIDLVDCSSFIDPVRDGGITGLLRLSDGGIVLAVQSPKPKIVFLNEDWTVRKVVRHPQFSDIHSLCERDGYVFCCSTGVNKILKISLFDHSVSLFWEYPIDQPMLHINSLVFHGERPLVSSHKVPPESPNGGPWAGCWYLDNYEVLMPDLKQPHTLEVAGDEVWCLSSHEFQVAIWRKGEVEFHPVQGYLRGMLRLEDGSALIGSSSKRIVSRKKGGMEKYADFDEVVGNPLFMSSLVICDPDLKPVRRINTTPIGFEIYDIIADPGVPERLRRRPAAAVRMQTMQRLLLSTREQLVKARREVEAG